MAALHDQLTQDLAAAMRGGDHRSRDVIRFLRAAIKNAEIEKQRPLSDDDIRAIIRTQIKQRRDAIELFRKGGREELAREEEAQIDVLQRYLPAQYNDSELAEIVVKVADALGASSPKDLGRLIGAVRAQVGERAEGRRISEAVRAELERRALTDTNV